MTIYTVLRISDKLTIDINEMRITVDDSVREVIGTSAELQPADSFTVNELLYGLMLPSGNDAAHVLAMHFGQLII